MTALGGQRCTCEEDYICALHGTGILSPEQLVVDPHFDGASPRRLPVPHLAPDRLGRGLASLIPQAPVLADLAEPLRQKLDDALDRALAELVGIDQRMQARLPAPPAGYHWTPGVEDQTDLSTNTYRMRIVYRLEADS